MSSDGLKVGVKRSLWLAGTGSPRHLPPDPKDLRLDSIEAFIPAGSEMSTYAYPGHADHVPWGVAAAPFQGCAGGQPHPSLTSLQGFEPSN